MIHDERTATLPTGSWLEDVSTAHPDVPIRILTVQPGDESAHGVLELVGDDRDAVLTTIERHEATSDVAVLHDTDDVTVLHVAADRPLASVPRDLRDGSTRPHVLVHGGTTTATLPSRAHRSVLETSRDHHGVDEGATDATRGRPRFLTDRQRELVRTAIEMGYYDTPRRCSMTDIADALGIAKSTCSETLHRAEETIVKSFAEERGVLETVVV